MSTMTVPAAPVADPRFPIGRFQRPGDISAEQRQAAVEAIAALPAQLREAVAGWSDAQLDTPYREGGWTVRQVVHHLADSHMQIAGRIRTALTSDNPTITPYDENAYAALPDGSSAPVESSLQILDGVHSRWVYLLQRLSAPQWQRTFVHPVTGTWTLDEATQSYSWHSRHHLAHVTELSRARGWS